MTQQRGEPTTEVRRPTIENEVHPKISPTSKSQSTGIKSNTKLLTKEKVSPKVKPYRQSRNKTNAKSTQRNKNGTELAMKQIKRKLSKRQQ